MSTFMRMNGGINMGLKERMVRNAEKRAAMMEEKERMLKESAVKAEYNEKGQIKRKGFKMGQATFYGEEFEEENFNRVFKPALVFLILFFVLFVLAGVIFFFFIQSDQFEPFLFKVIFENMK